MPYEIYIRTKHSEEQRFDYSFETMDEAKAYAFAYAETYWPDNTINWARPVECWQKIHENVDTTCMEFLYALYHVNLNDKSYIKIKVKQES